MHTLAAIGDSSPSLWRLSHWLRVREFAVPPPMIESATARRHVGDWAGACAAAGIDVDLNLRRLARTHGHELAARIRSDLRHLAPDLLRWHMPRVGPGGLLRPGLTIALARYGEDSGRRTRALHLVIRTPPAWASAGQRISLALWDGSDHATGTSLYPHPRPSRRFRLDLHPHLWDARRADELRARSGADLPPSDVPGFAHLGLAASDLDALGSVPDDQPCAVDRWAAEAEILLRADGRPPRTGDAVAVRLGARLRLIVEPGTADGARRPALRVAARATGRRASELPVLPDAATWIPPDLELLRAGLVDGDQLHPLVAAALIPGYAPPGTPASAHDPGQARFVDCRGARHRLALVDGALTALDHDPDELRREELLVALTGTPLPCLQAIDTAHRRPDCLTGVRERLDHGDNAGALAIVEELLGREAVLRDGALLDDLAAAAERRITYGLFRAGLIGRTPQVLCPRPVHPRERRSRRHRSPVR